MGSQHQQLPPSTSTLAGPDEMTPHSQCQEFCQSQTLHRRYLKHITPVTVQYGVLQNASTKIQMTTHTTQLFHTYVHRIHAYSYRQINYAHVLDTRLLKRYKVKARKTEKGRNDTVRQDFKETGMSWKEAHELCQLLLTTNRKSHIVFRLIPISVTLNDPERPNHHHHHHQFNTHEFSMNNKIHDN